MARCPPLHWSGHLSHDLVTGSLTGGRAVQIASGARRELAAGRVTIAELSTRRGGHETPGRHPAAFGDGKTVPAAVCRLGDLNNKPEDGQLNTQPEHEPQGDRRK